MANGVYLHPDYIGEIVEDLLACCIISKDKVEKLKNDDYKCVDPKLLMDVRHKEVKKESLIDGDSDKTKFPLKRNVEVCSLKTLPKVKDLKMIEKEIATTKKHIESIKNQLTKKNEFLTSTILDLEKKREDNISSPVVLNLNETEAKHYFNLHLDHLEGNIIHNFRKEKMKTWKPFEVKPPPIMNVITTMKVVDFKQTEMKFDEEELKLLAMCELAMCDLKPVIHITGKSLQGFSLETQISTEEMKNVVVPSNSPLLDGGESPFCKLRASILFKEEEIERNVIKIWKTFVETKRTQKLKEGKREQLRINILKHYFTKWIKHVNYCKVERAEIFALSSDNKTISSPIKNNSIKSCKVEMIRSLDVPKIVEPCFVTQSINISTKKQNTETVLITRNLKSNSTDKNKILVNNSMTTCNNPEESKIHVKVVTPEDVGLVNTKTVLTKPALRPIKTPKDKAKQTSTKEDLLKKSQEPLANRYAAQEKIIAQQLSVIEKQKQLILDLQTEHLKTQSKLSLKTTENYLAKAPATFEKKLCPLIKTIMLGCTAASEDTNKKQRNTEDKSEKLIKSMMERQEYCKQLAEMTRMRKKRIEEERAQVILEKEEKQRQEKEELKRLRSLKIKMEQELAEENARNTLATKCRMAELREKAIRHYNCVLLKKTFKALKRIYSEIDLKAEECNQIYKRKLLKRKLAVWRSAVKQAVSHKYQLADKHYCTKLVEHCWNIWHRLHEEYMIKVQVSEDLFALKVQERMFRRWMEFTAQQYLQTCCKMELADRLHRKQLLNQCLRHWKEFPKLMFAEREKEQRRRAWRQAVQELIPDFSPVFAEKLEL